MGKDIFGREPMTSDRMIRKTQFFKVIIHAQKLEFNGRKRRVKYWVVREFLKKDFCGYYLESVKNIK